MLVRTLILATAGAMLLGACSKTEPPPPSKPMQPAAPKAAAPAPGPSAAAEIDEGLKDRLARQEAAARMFEKNVLQPPAPRVPEPPPPAVKAAQPAPPAASVPPSPAQPAAPRSEATKSEAPRPEPAKVAARSEPPKAGPSAAAPQPSQPAASAPRTDIAAARPAPAPESTAARLLNRVDPDFPREAVQAGVEQGNVRARMTLDASGNVTRVEIVDATPRRVFDRAVVRALSQWRYSDGAAGRTVDMEVAFKR